MGRVSSLMIIVLSYSSITWRTEKSFAVILQRYLNLFRKIEWTFSACPLEINFLRTAKTLAETSCRANLTLSGISHV